MSGEVIGLQERPSELPWDKTCSLIPVWLDRTVGKPEQRKEDLETPERFAEVLIDIYLGIR